MVKELHQTEVGPKYNGGTKMASFLRAKQAGVQRDFSAGLDPQLFAIDEVGGCLTLRSILVPSPMNCDIR